MRKYSRLRVILAAVAGLLIGVVVTAIVNMIVPGTNLGWLLIAICLSSLLSGVAGSLIGARPKPEKQNP
jgi:small basic protein